jgi:transcriptional regulator with XRE-family HTH domain
MTALARRIRERLQELEWTQETLAEHAGLATSSVSDILNTKRLPRPETLHKLALALNMAEAELTALAGYAIDGAPTLDEARLQRLARLLQTLPWLEAGVEKLLQLSDEEQDDILAQIEFRLSRRSRKD